MLSSKRSLDGSRTEPIRTLAVGLPPSAARSEVIFPEIASSVIETETHDLDELKRHYSNLIIQIDRMRPTLGRIPIDARVSDMQWSLGEVFGHLIDTDRDIWWPRIDQLLVEDAPTFTDVDPDTLVDKHGWQSLPLDDILAQLMRVRWNNSMRLNTLPPAAFERSGTHPEHGEISLAQILAILVAHDAHYLSLVRSLIEDSSQ